MIYPDETILLARGKYSTLGKERRDLLKRVQSACSLLINEASQIMRDAEKDVPSNEDYLRAAYACLDQARDARERLVEVCKDMQEIKDLAWGYMDYDDKSPREPAEAEA